MFSRVLKTLRAASSLREKNEFDVIVQRRLLIFLISVSFIGVTISSSLSKLIMTNSQLFIFFLLIMVWRIYFDIIDVFAYFPLFGCHI